MTRDDRPTVLFDLDGTLIDSFEGLSRSYAHAFAALGRDELPMEAFRSCVGPPLRGNFARLLASDDTDLIERAVAAFRERYDALGWSECRVYDGVPEMLAGVRALGTRVAILTAKPQKFTDRIVAHHGLDRHVDASHGPTLDGSLDDKRRLLAHVIERTGLDPRHAAVVGDRHTDVVAATTHGALPVGVTWGYGSRDELTSAGATILCDRPSDVVARVTEWLAERSPSKLRQPRTIPPPAEAP